MPFNLQLQAADDATRKLAAKKIDILNVYASAPASYGPCTLVMVTNNNQKALVTLKK